MIQDLKLYQSQPEFPTCAALGEYLTYHSEDLHACTASTVVEQWHPECDVPLFNVCPVATPLLLVVLVTAMLTTFVVKLLSRIWPSEKGGD